MKAASGGEPRGDEARERRLHQAALVMARLRPRIWKQQLHLIEASGCDLMVQNLDRVLLYDTQVTELGLARRQQQVAYARPVYFDAEEAPLGRPLRALEQRLAIAEADLERASRDPSEYSIQVKDARLERDAIARPQRGERALLRLGDATGAHHVRAHAAHAFGWLLHARSIRCE